MVTASHFLRDAKLRHSSRLIKRPAVSIILPTYCRAQSGLLRRAIDNVLAQPFQSFELIVMDDGSSDGTEDILAEYVRQDDRIIHVRHDNNCGLPGLRVNEGLTLSRGQYCAYQFDDDRWTSNSLGILVGQLESHDDYGVAYGKSEITEVGREKVTIGGPFDYSKLVNGNYIANNSLIHRREVFERFGGYDMHLVMRRLCDWDLWLRWGREVRFLFVDELVSVVDAAMEDSLGKTAHHDGLTARAYMSRPRNHLLTPDVLQHYELDNLAHLKHLGENKVREIWRQQVAPFKARHREIWPKVHMPHETRKHVLLTKAAFDTTVDITINNFREALAENYVFTFIPQIQVDENVIRAIDILILYRTIDAQAEELQKIAKKHGKCVIYLMDDDLLSFHELSEEFSYLAPGAPCRAAMESLISDSDLMITYSRLMQESVSPLNPRNVLLDTNIRGHWLQNAESRLAEVGGKLGSTSSSPIKIGFAGGAARKEEFAILWPAIVAASQQLKNRAEFHFWGLTPEDLHQLESPSFCERFTFSYDEYLSRLTKAEFDIMIAPLFGEVRAKRAKCPIKFLESTAAGAVGVFSDVEPYQVVQDGRTGFKCVNTVEAWTQAILKAATLTPAQRHTMRSHSLERVKRDYASERQAPWVLATLEAALLHASLKRASGSGKARIAYFCHSPYLGGAENHLLRHALIAKHFQFEPILVLPAFTASIQDEMQRRAAANGISVSYLPLIVETEVNRQRELNVSAIEQISAWLAENEIALVHSVTLMREVGEAARLANVPRVASLYATNSIDPAEIDYCDVLHSDSILYANQWSQVLAVPSSCILSNVPDSYFEIGEIVKNSVDKGQKNKIPRIGIFGTLQSRKGQKQSIEAVGLLARDHGVKVALHIYGYDHFFPDYLADCKAVAEEYGITEQISFHGFVQNTAAVLAEIDIVLCASDWESLPQVILEGMAARKLIITPTVGGVAEVVSDKNGIIIKGNSALAICGGILKAINLDDLKLETRLDLAQLVVELECSKYAVASSLFQLYQLAQKRFKPTERQDVTNSALNSDRDSILLNTLLKLKEKLRDERLKT